MFLFNWTFGGVCAVVLYAVVLIAVYELTRWKKEFYLVVFGAVPIILLFFVWPTSTQGQGFTWFNYAKTASVIIPAMTFVLWSTFYKSGARKWVFCVWFIALAVNIAEAVARDFQIGLAGDAVAISGIWNYMNGIAGIINIITITGFMGGMIVAKGRGKKGTDYSDMVVPDMPWFWIIAYDLWNFAFVYNSEPNLAAFSGIALLVSCTIPALFVKKGSWFQARARTLGIHCMFVMSAYFLFSLYPVTATLNPVANLTVSGLALVFNVGVLVYQIFYMKKHSRSFKSLFTHDLYHGTKDHRKVYMDNIDLPEDQKEAAYAHFGKNGYKGIFYGWQRFHPFASVTPKEEAFEKDGDKNWIVKQSEDE